MRHGKSLLDHIVDFADARAVLDEVGAELGIRNIDKTYGIYPSDFLDAAKAGWTRTHYPTASARRVSYEISPLPRMKVRRRWRVVESTERAREEAALVLVEALGWMMPAELQLLAKDEDLPRLTDYRPLLSLSAREYSISVGPQMVEPRNPTVFRMHPQLRFRVTRLIVSPLSAPHFTIVGLRVNGREQFEDVAALPAAAFTEVAVGAALTVEPADPGQLIELQVMNNSSTPQQFMASLIGTTMEPMPKEQVTADEVRAMADVIVERYGLEPFLQGARDTPSGLVYWRQISRLRHGRTKDLLLKRMDRSRRELAGPYARLKHLAHAAGA